VVGSAMANKPPPGENDGFIQKGVYCAGCHAWTDTVPGLAPRYRATAMLGTPRGMIKPKQKRKKPVTPAPDDFWEVFVTFHTCSGK
jgi:hypothetical protein